MDAHVQETPLLLLAAVVLLAACEDGKERGERYYQSALALLEAGDTDRALLELRNVFDNDGFHKEARQLYADLLVERGDMKQAYSQYLRLIEQYPDTVEARRRLAELALDSGDWDEVRRHATAAIALEPDLPAHKALATALAYRSARDARDDVKAGEAVAEAEALLETDPDLDAALRLMIDWTATGPEPARALPYLDRMLALHPGSLPLHMLRLRVLDSAGLDDGIGPQLRDMVTRFPEDAEVADLLTAWYVSSRDLDAAEAFLRERAGPDDGAFEAHVAVAQLVGRMRGAEAFLAELDRLAEANAGSHLGRRYALAAALARFEQDMDRPAALATVTRLVDEIEQDGLRNEARIALSRMRAATGDPDGARSLVDAVLESDPSNVQGLLSRAAWRIRDEAYAEAITDLRQALGQDPRNADLLLLEAEAQQKLGNAELAEQRLAQAVEVSGGAPRVALIYANFQLARGNLDAADQVLTDSLRASGDLEVARLLGQVLLRKGDVEGAQTVFDQLSASDNPNAAPLARALQAGILFNQNRIEESLAFLRNSVGEGGGEDLDSALQILRIQMMSGRIEEARSQLAALRARYPGSVALRLLEGNMLDLEGKTEAAVAVYRRLLEENPGEMILVQRLYAALKDAGRGAEASDLLVRVLEDTPGDRSLRLLRALELERAGEIDAAIDIYEALYAETPDDPVVANNLASMLAYYRENSADLERAHRIARRLTGLNIPALLDTLGYIEFRRGELDRAILNLQAAARGLPQEPTIAFNLAQAYAAAGRTDEARAELARGTRTGGRAQRRAAAGRGAGAGQGDRRRDTARGRRFVTWKSRCPAARRPGSGPAGRSPVA